MLLAKSADFCLEHSTSVGLVTAGRFDGVSLSLAAVSKGSGGAVVVVFDPPVLSSSSSGEAGGGGEVLRLIELGRRASLVSSVALDPSRPSKDFLIVGTLTGVSVLDIGRGGPTSGAVEQEGGGEGAGEEIFFAETGQRATCIFRNETSGSGTPLVLVGGDAGGLFGFDFEGRESVWVGGAFAGDRGGISGMGFADVDGDGRQELILGRRAGVVEALRSDGSVSKGSRPVGSPVISLRALASEAPDDRALIAYGCEDGSIGGLLSPPPFGAGGWVFKRRGRGGGGGAVVTSLSLGRLGLGSEVVCGVAVGWSDGRVEVRRGRDGAVVFSEGAERGATARGAVCWIDLVEDFRGDGSKMVLAVYANGDVLGWSPSFSAGSEGSSQAAGAVSASGSLPSPLPPKLSPVSPSGPLPPLGPSLAPLLAGGPRGNLRPSLASGGGDPLALKFAQLLVERRELEKQLSEFREAAAGGAGMATADGSLPVSVQPPGALPGGTRVRVSLESFPEGGGGQTGGERRKSEDKSPSLSRALWVPPTASTSSVSPSPSFSSASSPSQSSRLFLVTELLESPQSVKEPKSQSSASRLGSLDVVWAASFCGTPIFSSQAQQSQKTKETEGKDGKKSDASVCVTRSKNGLKVSMPLFAPEKCPREGTEVRVRVRAVVRTGDGAVGGEHSSGREETSRVAHLFESELRLPPFWWMCPASALTASSEPEQASSSPTASSFVSFSAMHAAGLSVSSSLSAWISSCFLSAGPGAASCQWRFLSVEAESGRRAVQTQTRETRGAEGPRASGAFRRGSGGSSVSFVSAQDNTKLTIRVVEDHKVNRGGGGGETVRIECEDLFLIVGVVRSLCRTLKVDSLENLETSFPLVVRQAAELLSEMQEGSRLGKRLRAECAENAGVMDALMQKADDSASIGDFRATRRAHIDLRQSTERVIDAVRRRGVTSTEMRERGMKLDSLIAAAADLRGGRQRQRVMEECRKAKKTLDVRTLVKALQLGDLV
uniref:BBS2 hairpin domain-containing protein n=1 Tax=Chromera velia CCMP2878 TaxID=1169474 RepID=A0A0G4HPT4_9ALVE|eukprot:Cvel_7825.t1-p1 / transcript=Cvel_7825.t1 / gene=Cvel_7825 / organism=Chromera_velia_CCMP2878 / gene_product=Bardet-Biedl syndrome 2 protein homolog, putative / transcript_product=Bardet-Biedl syndrome 2 protein homolog, putative / location=Cvel_scaffold418:1266-10412(-) / protein_length=999 / sequence_SO=supercontig / SO=protein_coding / is_pseudo=false